ncbi:MAG: alpha/beta hydrolase family esterase [Woeseiaceae bacterium]
MQSFAFEHEGVKRDYYVHVPPAAKGPLPVVVGLHGYTSTATGFANAHELNKHADQHGYIAVYPQATSFMIEPQNSPAFRITTWNSYDEAGPDFDAPPHCTAESSVYACPPGCGECHRCQWEPCTNDVEFIRKVLDEVQLNFDTDVGRYYVLGVSSGGIMTTRIACSLADRFAAAAPIIGLQPPGHACASDIDLPVMFLMGALDETVRFDGRAGKDDGFIYATLAESGQIHAEAMACATGPVSWRSDLATAAGVECSAYSDCRVNGHAVVSCLDPKGAHIWPRQGASNRPATCVEQPQIRAMPEKSLCEPVPENSPHAGMDLVWTFFSRYRRD